MIIGTSYFVDKAAAVRYYAPYGYDSTAVQAMFDADEIHLGKPPLARGDAAKIDRAEGRYYILTQD